MAFLLVFLGSGVGGAMRYGVGSLCGRLGWAGFPIATMVVNVVGSFLMGVAISFLTIRAQPNEQWRLFITTGVLGGFTTFSAFSLDTIDLWHRGRPVLAAAYALSSVALSLGALVAGLALVRCCMRA